MKKGLLLFSSIGLGAGLMYLFDPTYGRRRRAQAHTRMRLARHRVGDFLDDSAQIMRNRAGRVASGSRSWLMHVPRTHQMLVAAQGRRSRQRQVDIGLLLLGCLGLGTVFISLVYAGTSSRQTTSHVATKTMRAAYDWTRGMVAGVEAWITQEKVPTENHSAHVHNS